MPVVQDAFDDLSLGEALDVFRVREGLAESTEVVSQEGQALLANHDIAHVLLGLSTELRHEAMVDAWTLFGTDARISDMKDYTKLAKEIDLVGEVGWWPMIGATFGFLWDLPGVFWRTRRQTRKWLWIKHEDFMGRTVGDLRQEFAIPRLLG